jgi:hypothetical protein
MAASLCEECDGVLDGRDPEVVEAVELHHDTFGREEGGIAREPHPNPGGGYCDPLSQSRQPIPGSTSSATRRLLESPCP